MKAQAFWIIVLAVAGAIALRDLFPKRETVIGPPRIVTQYDTVRQLDTAWIVKLKHDTVTINTIEKVTVTVAETVRVLQPLAGITAVSVAPKVGDSTLVAGFTLAPLPDSSGYLTRAWTAQYYTLGPLKSLVLDPKAAAPRINFYDPPAKPCGFFCAAKHYVVGSAIGYGACQLSHVGR